MGDETKALDLEAIERGRMADETWELHERRHCNPWTCVHAEASRARKSEAALVAEVKRLRTRLSDAERAFDRATVATQERVAEWERRAKVLAEMADQLKRRFT